ncbi:MAG: PQQ-binding-like beta-propeller repeat protein [Candidatus Riflebacteria bacterium]|nr:PQQ-binding-like beta-propeller repeat protein [Candidatus Riflebacteria bacterium]
MDQTIPFQPVREENRVVFPQGYEHLAWIDSQKQFIVSELLPSCIKEGPFSIGNGKTLILGVDGFLRAFSESLTLLWELKTDSVSLPKPLIAKNGTILALSDDNTLVAVSPDHGKLLWRRTFPEKIVHFFVDKSVFVQRKPFPPMPQCVMLDVINLESGEQTWKMNDPVLEDQIFFYDENVVFVDSKGFPKIVNQKTGKILYVHPVGGLRIAGNIGAKLFFLSKGGSVIETFSLSEKSFWSITLETPLLKFAGSEKRFYLFEKRLLRVFDLNLGKMIEERKYGRIFSVNENQRKISFIFQNNSISGTLITILDVETGNTILTAREEGNFWVPINFGDEWFLANQNGAMKWYFQRN